MEAKPVSVGEMRGMEEKAFSSGTTVLELMEKAGRECARLIVEKAGPGKKIVILCGPGNNGGDGLVCARYLSENNDVSLVLPIEPKTDAAKENLEKAKGTPVKFVPFKNAGPILESAEIAVDALLGIGAKGGLRSPIKEACQLFNSSEAFKISIDVPTGMDADTGERDENAALPDATICIQSPKTGVAKNWENSGRLWIADVGL
ncbi:MAG: NAD(P)H-hydrate epimerase [Candidatus Micrarchaeota archaeon]